MARISGVNIPTNKRASIALTYIFGIGPKRAEDICTKASIEKSKRVNQLTDEEIETAFKALPEAVQDETIEDIKAHLKARRDNLGDIAQRYYNYLQEFQVLPGTEEDDVFNIVRKENGITAIEMINEDRS